MTANIDRALRNPNVVLALTVVLALLAVATVVNFILVGSALSKYKSQAKAGERANQRSCELYPVSKKLYAGAAKYRIISRADLELYQRVGAPKGCATRP